MSKGVPLKVVIVAMLVGVALIRNGVPASGLADRLVLGMLALGIFNALVSPPGTLWVRGFGIVCSFMGLLLPDGPRASAVLLLWLVWPPAYLVAWSMESERFAAPHEPPSGHAPSAARGILAAIIAAVSLAYLAYKGIFAHQLQQTAALFIGIPVLQLGPTWLAGEAIGLLIGLIPGQLLARWTIRGEHLAERAALQVVAFCGLIMFLLPASAIEGSGSTWTNPLTRPKWQFSLIVQILAIPALVGLSAVQEFVTRGGGTPVPFDPPPRLVTTGPYAYVRNPMQLSAVALLLLLGVALQNFWTAVAGVMAHIYSAGLAGWDEDEDLHRRFGAGWDAYRRGVRSWLPRTRPWIPADQPPARLYVSESCGMCSEVGRWLHQRGASGLTIMAAETHSSHALTRITYESGDGTCGVTGVEAVARALEHVHLGWAVAGCVLQLPVLCQCVQLLVDASGGGPRLLRDRNTAEESMGR